MPEVIEHRLFGVQVVLGQRVRARCQRGEAVDDGDRQHVVKLGRAADEAPRFVLEDVNAWIEVQAAAVLAVRATHERDLGAVHLHRSH